MTIKTTQIFKKHYLLLLVFILLKSNSLFSQVISAPNFIDGSPLLCVEQGSDPNYKFYFNSTGFNTNETFKLEMSDGLGSFANPVVQDTKVLSNSNSNFLTLTVLSTFIGGDNYKFRVVNTTSGLISPESGLYAIYYKAITNLVLNNNSSFATICQNGAILSVTNVPAAILASSKFKWYKKSSPSDQLITNETGSSIQVTSQGTYYVTIKYGLCSNSAIKSQDVNANSYTSGGTYIITSSKGEFVAPGAPTTLTIDNINPGSTYQWFDLNGLIAGETSSTLITEIPSIYFVEVNDGICPTPSNKLKLSEIPTPPFGSGNVIPNIISINNDNENDKWVIEEKYTAGNSNILILDSKGNIAFETNEYRNDWPDSTIEFDTINPVYYYIITPKEGEIKKGSITIVK